MTARITEMRTNTPNEPEIIADDPPDEKSSRVGYELLGAVLAGVGMGYLVDTQLGSTPICAVAGLFLGFIAGVANAWRATNGIERAVGLRPPEQKTERDAKNRN